MCSVAFAKIHQGSFEIREKIFYWNFIKVIYLKIIEVIFVRTTKTSQAELKKIMCENMLLPRNV